MQSVLRSMQIPHFSGSRMLAYGGHLPEVLIAPPTQRFTRSSSLQEVVVAREPTFLTSAGRAISLDAVVADSPTVSSDPLSSNISPWFYTPNLVESTDSKTDPLRSVDDDLECKR
jgi:hypothetical protein